MTEDSVPSVYVERVGERLRTIRRQKGLSLQEVESESDHEFKASVLGAYERGERAISVPRLQRLGRFYNVPVDQLLPQEGDAGADADAGWSETTGWPGTGSGHRRAAADPVEHVTIDLTRLDGVEAPEVEVLERYATMIQRQRQDFNGRVLTIRVEDLRTIACVMGTDLARLARRLDELGLRASR